MIRLTLYTLLHHLVSWGVRPLIATRTVAADAAALHRFCPSRQTSYASSPNTLETWRCTSRRGPPGAYLLSRSCAGGARCYG
jgi:hypothetical protein